MLVLTIFQPNQTPLASSSFEGNAVVLVVMIINVINFNYVLLEQCQNFSQNNFYHSNIFQKRREKSSGCILPHSMTLALTCKSKT